MKSYVGAHAEEASNIRALAGADDSYMVADGTSMAACFVTGTLALMKEQFPIESY